jgi:hypothetical protein
MSKKRNWPPELKGPFPMQQLEDQAHEVADETGQQEQVYTSHLRELWEAETRRRVALIAQFFGKPWPQGEIDWLELVFQLCVACEAPGFTEQIRPAGAPKRWSNLQNRRLFADVMSVVTETKLSAYAAVRHLTSNPNKFLNRYVKYTGKPKTLHRQFVRAKTYFEKLDRTHPGPALWPMSRDEMIKHMIDTYSAEAEVKRSRITQK